MEAPVCLCHLLIHLAFKLKFFGDDAYGKVSAWCKIGAAAVNLLIEKKTLFCFLQVLFDLACLLEFAQ
jgi:hypothetical protein